MRISDWSADVCSSDLEGRDAGGHQDGTQAPFGAEAHRLGHAPPIGAELAEIGDHDQSVEHRDAEQGDKAHRGGNRQIFSRSPERSEARREGKEVASQFGTRWATDSSKKKKIRN